MAVVQEVVLDDRQSGGRGDFVKLPPGRSYLSTGGDITRLRRGNAELIFLFDFRGILSSLAGFVYSTGGYAT